MSCCVMGCNKIATIQFVVKFYSGKKKKKKNVSNKLLNLF